MNEFIQLYGDSVKTALGFFWKAGWAFILGYFISGMIQSFVPRKRLTKYMGKADVRSILLSTVFGGVSSSCSFAALAAARALVRKGAHFIAAVAFMFASTNLVIELGILILIFLGWQFLAAEIIGGLLLILISSVLMRMTYPKKWLDAAREMVESETGEEKDDFDWKKRIMSRKGWYLVGHSFVMDWKMVWEDILIGFTVAGFVAVLVPAGFWSSLFLTDLQGKIPMWLIHLENAVVAPFVAAATFIGSMGNIPLATVLNSRGVLFAGIMGFIYSDLMVPPLVRVNAKYYGWRVALYIAGVMFVSIVITALILQSLFSAFGIIPESGRSVQEAAQFSIDYTFWINIVFIGVAGWMLWLNHRYMTGPGSEKHKQGMQMEGSGLIKRTVVYAFIAVLVLGAGAWIYSAAG